MKDKKLYKDSEKGKLSGVIAGLADYADIDVGVARLLFIALVIFTGFFPGVFFYFVAAIILDDKPAASTK